MTITYFNRTFTFAQKTPSYCVFSSDSFIKASYLTNEVEVKNILESQILKENLDKICLCSIDENDENIILQGKDLKSEKKKFYLF